MPANKGQREWLGLLKMHREIVNNLFDLKDDFVEPEDYGTIPFWEMYVRGYVGCHIHFSGSVRGEGDEFTPCHFCADFQVRLGMGVVEFEPLSITNVHDGGEGMRLGIYQEWLEHPVFIFLRENPKEIKKIPSIVGLRPLDDCPGSGGNIRGNPLLLGEPQASAFNREFNPFDSFRWDCPTAIVTSQLPKEIIERTSEVMDDLSGDGSDSEVEILGDVRYPKDIISRSRFDFGAQWKLRSGNLFFGRNFRFNDFGEFMRPLDFSSALTNIDGHSHLHVGGLLA